MLRCDVDQKAQENNFLHRDQLIDLYKERCEGVWLKGCRDRRHLNTLYNISSVSITFPQSVHVVTVPQAVVHISTAYTQVDRKDIEEKIYDAPVSPVRLIQMIKWENIISFQIYNAQ